MSDKRRERVMFVGLFLVAALGVGCAGLNEYFDSANDPTPTPEVPNPPTRGEQIDNTVTWVAGTLAALGVPGALLGGKLWGALRPGKALEEVVRGTEKVRDAAMEGSVSRSRSRELLRKKQSKTTADLVDAITGRKTG